MMDAPDEDPSHATTGVLSGEQHRSRSDSHRAAHDVGTPLLVAVATMLRAMSERHVGQDAAVVEADLHRLELAGVVGRPVGQPHAQVDAGRRGPAVERAGRATRVLGPGLPADLRETVGDRWRDRELAWIYPARAKS